MDGSGFVELAAAVYVIAAFAFVFYVNPCIHTIVVVNSTFALLVEEHVAEWIRLALLFRVDNV